jgi:hypothetical protein
MNDLKRCLLFQRSRNSFSTVMRKEIRKADACFKALFAFSTLAQLFFQLSCAKK